MTAATNPRPDASVHAELARAIHQHVNGCRRCRIASFARDVTPPCCREGARLHRAYRTLRRLERLGAA